MTAKEFTTKTLRMNLDILDGCIAPAAEDADKYGHDTMIPVMKVTHGENLLRMKRDLGRLRAAIEWVADCPDDPSTTQP